MKKIVFYLHLLCPLATTSMEKIWHHAGPTFSSERSSTTESVSDSDEEIEPKNDEIKLPKPQEVPSLRSLCLDKIVHYLQHDPRYHASLAAHLPLDLAHPLLEKLNELISAGKKIATFPARGKISPDGTKVLVGVDDTRLRVYESATGALLFTLEDSITSDDKRPGDGYNRRSFPIKWSPMGRYIYACFNAPQKKSDEPYQYLYKVWDSLSGKKLYQVPSTPVNKVYFSPHDQFLLSKSLNRQLEVYHGATGVHAATLGAPTFGHSRYPQDPQNQWLTVYNGSRETELYDTQSFTRAQKLNGLLKCFSADGNLMAVKVEEDTGKSTKIREQITAPYAHIYNRQFQNLATIPLITGGFHDMAISPCRRSLICYESDREIRYSIATEKEIEKLEHNSDLKGVATFSNFTGSSIIILQKKGEPTGETTQVTIVHNNIETQLICPVFVNRIRYTENVALVGLQYYDIIRYFLNIKTGTLTHCHIPLKHGLFKYKPTRALCHDYFVTRVENNYELRQLPAFDKLLPCVQLLADKLKSAQHCPPLQHP